METLKSHFHVSISFDMLRHFNLPSFAFLAFFVYQYLFPQYFYPFIYKFQIPKLSVSICILYALLCWKRHRIIHARLVIWCFLILGTLFFIHRFYVDAPDLTQYYFSQNLHQVAVGLILLYYFKDTNKINLVIVMFILFTSFAAFVAIKEGGLIWGHDFLQDENQISALLCMSIPVTVFYSVFTQAMSRKMLCYLALLLQFSAIIVSRSRGGFVALLVVIICMVLFSNRRIFFLFLTVVAVIGVFHFAPAGFFSEMSTLSEGTQEATAGARIEYWRRAVLMFSESPIMGKGIGQFPVLSHKYALPDRELNEGDFLVCHSNWFQILSELGIVGAILYSAIFYEFFKAAFLVLRRHRNLGLSRLGMHEYSFYHNIAIGLAIGMIGFMVAGSFINILIFPYYYSFVFLMMLVKTTFLEKIQGSVTDGIAV